MTANDVVMKLYGINGYINENPLIPQANTTPQQVFGSNPQRVQLFIVNLGANPAYISFSPQPSATNGILLGANGGNLEFDVVNDTIVPTRPFYIVTTGGSSDIYSFETISY